jgi:phosphoserine phosphatase
MCYQDLNQMLASIFNFPASALLRGRPLFALLLFFATGGSAVFAASDPLPSWNDGPVKSKIEEFVFSVSNPDSRDFVPAADRIATFDNDGTLMSEQPNINEEFALDQVHRVAPLHPEWNQIQPFKAILANDEKYLAHMGREDIKTLYLFAYSGTEETTFEKTAREWLESAHTRGTNMRYLDLVYQPQRELLQFLRNHGFKIYLVSGGDVDFLRTFSADVYGIEPNRVIGSSVRFRYVAGPSGGHILRLPEIDTFNDGHAKVSNIHLITGSSPILAFGNSDGDEGMLAMSAMNDHPHLSLVLHHDDVKREFAYDRAAPPFARLNRVLDEAPSNHWLVVSMKHDFRTVYAGAGRVHQ